MVLKKKENTFNVNKKMSISADKHKIFLFYLSNNYLKNISNYDIDVICLYLICNIN